MAHLNLYIPDALKKQLERKARAAGKSLSAYMTELAQRTVASNAEDWEGAVRSTSGSWQGEFPAIEQLTSEKREIWTAAEPEGDE